MISLKTFCGELSPFVGISLNGLYERQRALVQIGALPQPVRGRGHGLSATPATVAPMLTALMATDNLANIARGFWTVGSSRSAGACQLTGKDKFNDAMAVLLGSTDLAKRVSRIEVSRVDQGACILFSDRRKKQHTSTFGKHRDFSDQLEVNAILWGHVLEKIAELLKSAMEDH